MLSKPLLVLKRNEIVKQMRGEAGPRQIKPYPEIAAQHNHGYGMHTAVTIFRAGK